MTCILTRVMSTVVGSEETEVQVIVLELEDDQVSPLAGEVTLTAK